VCCDHPSQSPHCSFSLSLYLYLNTAVHPPRNGMISACLPSL
jgi:hypothetical protein